jgi:V/A-type H+-transporting ATPase subunit I
MFGMMFGDVGHGAVIAIGALMFVRRSSVVAIIGVLAGLSSTIFGFLYGSIFGYEHVLHPLWMSPMHDPQHVLLLALYWGIGFLIIANLLAIRNMLAREEFQHALYSPQGVTGLIFYIATVFSLMQVFEVNSLPVWTVPLLSILMAGMLYYQWGHSSGSLVERGLVVFIEGLEFIISNVSATLSFLRVAAFTLNHIALAAAVFAIAAMLDTFGHWVTILLGNLFIIVLEGAIVAIQCLRLEYYEGFSRFFSGKGTLYQPLKSDPL